MLVGRRVTENAFTDAKASVPPYPLFFLLAISYLYL